MIPLDKVKQIVDTYKDLEKEFYKHNVDIVFAGHIHNYERMLPIYNK